MERPHDCSEDKFTGFIFFYLYNFNVGIAKRDNNLVWNEAEIASCVQIITAQLFFWEISYLIIKWKFQLEVSPGVRFTDKTHL